jgi:hypothetical protein
VSNTPAAPKKPVHAIHVKFKVHADVRPDAIAFVERFLRVAAMECVDNEPATHKAIKHYQIKP